MTEKLTQAAESGLFEYCLQAKKEVPIETMAIACEVTKETARANGHQLIVNYTINRFAMAKLWHEYNNLLAENQKLREANEILAKEQR